MKPTNAPPHPGRLSKGESILAIPSCGLCWLEGQPLSEYLLRPQSRARPAAAAPWTAPPQPPSAGSRGRGSAAAAPQPAGSSWTRRRSRVLCTGRKILDHWTTGKPCVSLSVCQAGRTGKRSPKCWRLQTRKGEAREMKREKARGPRAAGRSAAPGWPQEQGPQGKQAPRRAGPVYRGQAQGERHTQRSRSQLSRSPARWGALLLVSLDRRALTPER